ncbi:hypothetical protein [Streptomyces sp. B3I7]|uniref:hypothetical protein n=1 Tax=Streptomyces sp. B3I7 TaxID=3042269 RepID=UPI0027D7A5A3|nr:hypothetical protein [Streptomyces sp. B3I7]
MPIALLLTTATTAAVGVAALRSLKALRRQVADLRTELAEHRAARPDAAVPAARTAADTDGIRAAVAEALAEERERELAEARAFWAAQEIRDIDAPSVFGGLDAPSVFGGLDAPSVFGGLPGGELFLPRQADFAGLEHDALEPVTEPTLEEGEPAVDPAELAAARRRHPSHPDFAPGPSPVVGDHERTVTCLEELAASRTALADVRPGPLGTLDVYVFADGTTLCMTPGHRETAERLAAVLRAGGTPVLLGGSGVSGAYSLTFECGEENVYILADRVIASL